MNDVIEQWQEKVRSAAAEGMSLRPRGGGTKDFFGRRADGEVLYTRALSGIVSYEPTELVVTVRAGTPLAELESMLAERGQRLPFEPPHFGDSATVGGCVASGLSGPSRLAVGALRDFVLGVKIIDGRGDLLAFGGQVMKNVAGYDVSRLFAGSLGTLGLLCEISLKVLPRPAVERTLCLGMGPADAVEHLNQWGGQPLPISASSWHEGELRLRLSGAEAAVAAAVARIGGEEVDAVDAQAWWRALREQRLAFFAEGDLPLWRLAVPSTTAPMAGDWFIEWGGGQRWLRSDASAEEIRRIASGVGGHATLFRGGDRDGEVFQPLAAPLMMIQRRLKQAFDPAGVFSPGRLYNGF
ncbi:MAG TPA: glycolate oxidase subunit GlcE [Azoarcus taiwanensis]|nr:glycolate oxidase subunit GlcE [Azoarcus taiwanensis]